MFHFKMYALKLPFRSVNTLPYVTGKFFAIVCRTLINHSIRIYLQAEVDK